MITITEIRLALSALSIIQSRLAVFTHTAKNELQIAQQTLDEAGTNNELIRQALSHMESAFSSIHKESYEDPTATFFASNNSPRRTANNDLCYQIALLHNRLGDGYNITKMWTNKLAIFTDIPDGFHDLLKREDYDAIVNRNNEAQEQRDWNNDTIDSTWPDF